MDFRYHAKTVDGKDIFDYKSAESEGDLIQWIRSNSWTPIDISQLDASASISIFRRVSGFPNIFCRVSAKDRAVMFRQLAVMVSSGIALNNAVNTLTAQMESGAFKYAMERVKDRLLSGVPLSDALYAERELFGDEAAAFLRPGEESGQLGRSLTALSQFLEERRKLSVRLVGALTYPALVILIAASVFFAMLSLVIPRFQTAFADLGAPVPALTSLTFTFGSFIRDNFTIMLLSLTALFLFTIFLCREGRFKELRDRILLNVPVFGDIVFKASAARAFKTASSLLEAGVPIAKSLAIASEAALNSAVGNVFDSMREAVLMGASMSGQAALADIFPDMAVNMIAAGEDSGRLGEMLGGLAEWYEFELNEKINVLASVLEPLIMLFVGLLVALVVFSVFLPIISAINALI
jgi:type IV pilus assembly protein PilC